jgi:hypothetical protein
VTASSLRRLGAASVWCLLALATTDLPAWAGEEASGVKADAGGTAAAIDTSSLRHGSRRRAGDGTKVVFDKVAGAFRAAGLGETWWIDGRYYRWDGGVWTRAEVAAGPWSLVALADVPAAARERYLPPKTTTTVKLPAGLEVVFEPRLKVYKVAGRKGVFLFDARFYRSEGGLWLEAAEADGPWIPANPRPLPVLLRKAVGEPAAGAVATLPSGEAVTWDARAKLFVLRDKPEVVLYEGKFFERRGPKWFESSAPSAGFAEKDAKDIPPAVRFKFRKDPSGAGPAKGAAAKKAPASGKKAKTSATDAGDSE